MQTQVDLSGFNGTLYYHRTSLFSPLVHTDGVESFASQAHAYWFLDICSTEIYELLNREYFLSIVMDVMEGLNGNYATIIVNDGDDNPMLTKVINYTDCPVGSYKFFMTDNVLMLTSEY
jgi:hypothetical protein